MEGVEERLRERREGERREGGRAGRKERGGGRRKGCKQEQRKEINFAFSGFFPSFQVVYRSCIFLNLDIQNIYQILLKHQI